MDKLIETLSKIRSYTNEEQSSFLLFLREAETVSKHNLAILDSSVKQLSDLCEVLLKNYQSKAIELQNLENQIELTKQSQKESLDTYNNKIVDSLKTIEKQKVEYDDLSFKIESLQATHDAFVIRREEDKDESIKIKNHLSDLESEERLLQSKILKLKDDVVSLEKEYGNLTNEVDSVNKELRSKREEIARINQQKNDI